MNRIYFLFIVTGTSVSASAQLAYKDVAGIFYNRCTSCHHPNGGAPFSMMNYSETAPWASLIQTDLNSGKMPPWVPDTAYTRFLHERIITAPEKNAILSWISSGTQAGDTTQAPAPPVYTSQYKLHGTPDLILKVPAFASNASANDAYNCFSVPTGLLQDRYVRAFEVVPNNAALVHHVVIKVDSIGNTISDTSGACLAQPGDYDLDVYAIGGAPTVFPGQAPLKCGIRIKAGSKLNFQIHYPPGTAGMIDSTQIRIFLYPIGETGIRQVYVFTPLQNWFMWIFANTTPTYNAHYPSSGGLPVALSVFGAFPHGHLVSKSMLNYADNGTSTIPLIRINNWDFDWQGFYTFRNLVKLPVGYTFRATHTFDNTTNNPNNPSNPPQFVQAGTGTTDEMLFDSYQYLIYQPGDELIDIGGLLANDTLLNSPVAVNETSAAGTDWFLFPNPSAGKVYIAGGEVPPYDITVFNVLGEKIYSNTNLWNESLIDLSSQLNGIYFVNIKTEEGSFTQKLIIQK